MAEQVLIYRALGRGVTKRGYVIHANAPLQDTGITALPPTVIVTAHCGPIANDGEAYRDMITAAGGKALWLNEAGLVHDCLRARHMSTRAAVLFDRVV